VLMLSIAMVAALYLPIIEMGALLI
jgi:hypothetical protein